MPESNRKKSPRAPTMALDEALERTGRAYDKERLHPASTDVVARNIGYKGANNGAALAALASLRYYGLIERPKEGVLAVAKDYENYRFAPDESIRRRLIRKFFETPPLFKELLDQYEGGFPSDATLKYELMQRGFLPQAAATFVGVLKRSAEFAGAAPPPSQANLEPLPKEDAQDAGTSLETRERQMPSFPAHDIKLQVVEGPSAKEDGGGHDRIPVRLTGNRRAWLIVPGLFFEADKARLKAQIDLLLTEDEEHGKH